MKANLFAMTTLMLGLSAASLKHLASIPTPSVNADEKPAVQPMPDPREQVAVVEAATYTEAQGKAVAELYMRRFTGLEPGEWFHDRAITLPNGVILNTRVGGVHVLFHSNERVLVTRYGRVTSLSHAINLGWLSFDAEAMARATAEQVAADAAVTGNAA